MCNVNNLVDPGSATSTIPLRSFLLALIVFLTACTAPPLPAALPAATRLVLASPTSVPVILPASPVPSTPTLTPTTAPPSSTPAQTQTPSATLTRDPAQVYQTAFGIDYTDPEKYLAQGDQTHLSDPGSIDSLRMEQQVMNPTHLHMLGRIYLWMKGSFRPWSAGGKTIGVINVDQLFADHKLGGCHDWALVYASLARELGYPAVVVDTVSLAWAKGFQSGEKGPYYGHVFVEVYADGKWMLVDSTNNWYVEHDYDPANPVIPLKGRIAGLSRETSGFYVMRKGLDTWDYGIHDAKALNQLMETTARQLQIETLVYPAYEFQRFR